MPDQARRQRRAAAQAGVHVVIGTTGWDEDELRAAVAGAPGNVFAAPNFAIGAVLMMRFAAEASKHHAAAPRSSSTTTRPSSTRRPAPPRAPRALMDGDVPIHSVRLPGLVADQDVILGDVAQTLTIRHVTTDRTSFMPGVLLAIRHVAELPESPVFGLERLLWPSSPSPTTRPSATSSACGARSTRELEITSRVSHAVDAGPASSRASAARTLVRDLEDAELVYICMEDKPRGELIVITLWEGGEDPRVPKRFTDVLRGHR